MRQATTQPVPVPTASSRQDRLSQDLTVLFVYGTLRFEGVLEALLGRIPQRVPASAPGWRAAALTGRVYPGLVAAADAVVSGLLLTDLSRREWAVLDAFEGDGYDLRNVDLTTGECALAYVWAGGDVREENWDVSRFKARHLREYTDRCARIAPGLASDADK
ncbi:gamma-glutamylcyclotransferase [Streptomyces brevispora]|uniref:gamma-glutamylcyclotransferase family protein n=1 Tax=Streptomyces brevispora TaxID=887462 RepID=UPI002E36ECB8|nr:gamma-glutamylcyclotransferase family protein [Streptomyces brevispora]